MSPRAAGCIYCGSNGPYNAEHVIPAGLGAGDAMQLRDLVCKQCNDDFSKLEVRVLRRGDIGLGRLALQEHGRDRGSKTKPPTFETTSAKLMTEDGRALEISLGHRLAAEILPQITQRGQFLEGGGTNRSKVEHFLTRLEGLLGNKVSLVRKRSSNTEPYTITQLELGATGYHVTGTSKVMRLSADVFWLEMPESDIPGSYPRVMERSQTSIAIQVVDSNVDAATAFLSLVKANLISLKVALLGTIQAMDIQQPQIRVSALAPQEDEVARLMAKIGFNLLVHNQGESLCRNECFDALCLAIRTGQSELKVNVWSDSEGILPMLRQIFTQQHWMMIAPIPNPAGGLGLAFGCSFYGGAARILLLADEFPAGFEAPYAFFAVNYQDHTVQHFNLAQISALIQAAIKTEPGTR